MEAVIDESGSIRLLEPLRIAGNPRVLVTILDDEPVGRVCETALLSEGALAVDWENPKEDAAWAHLQKVQ